MPDRPRHRARHRDEVRLVFSYGGERLGQGRNNAKGFLDEHQEIAREIEAKIYAATGADRDLVAPIEREDDVAAPVLADLPDVEAAA